MGIIKQSYRFLTAILLLTICQTVFAQISDTSNYFNHEVKKGETSFGIAKQYKIDLNLFFDFNPSASDGIKKGDFLKIPVLSSKALSHNILKKFSEDPKLLVGLCHVRSDFTKF